MNAERNSVLINFQKKIQYEFKNQALIDQALTHSSYANEHKDQHSKDNERLEFLGDAILDLIVSEYLFKKYPNFQEGDLSKLRASIVCEASLAETAKTLDIGEFILLGKGEEMTGGKTRCSILADAFEAITGAMFVDGEFADVRKFLTNTLIASVKDVSTTELYTDYKTILQIEVQKEGKEAPKYQVIDESGPDHDKDFVVQLTQEGKVIGTGKGKSKREAEQHAAHMALKQVYNVSK
ncbi:MAG: ribonuclease III [Epulopiscium sp. Nele67-Bin004]|nr:MAG: ribonuclease III [Epulopiscium sp. Nele67-Bin004]